MELKDLPSVDRLASRIDEDLPWPLTVEIARSTLEEARSDLNSGRVPGDLVAAARAKAKAVTELRFSRVINATGVLLHTNLGRAPVSDDAARAALVAGTTYGSLEFDLSTGRRGRRGAYLVDLIVQLTGAEAALVVNNNAGAVFLALVALANGRSVPISRGELVEIGGSYRLPELIKATGAHMVEIGTTNRTRLMDYKNAIDETTGIVLKVHPSNFRIAGFSKDVPPVQLATLSIEHKISFVYDVGSGLLDERTPWLSGSPPGWLADEPGVVQMLEAGADLVTFSGDKLLGGPQAGVIVGKQDLVQRLSKHPAARALRIDGPTIAALTATFEAYANGTAAELPFWRMAAADRGELDARSQFLASYLGPMAQVLDSSSVPGGGAVPGADIPGPVVAIEATSAETLWDALLRSPIPVVARRSEERLLVDLRTVDPIDDEALRTALEAACRS